MKRILSMVVMVLLATPAFAARVHLKDGSIIEAKRVWRSGGKIHVLATRHTMTSFEPSEVNLKRTFARHHKAKKKTAAVPQTAANLSPAAVTVPAEGTSAEKKRDGLVLNTLPALPEKKTGNSTPPGSTGGSIRKHRKEMADKTPE